MLTVEAKDVEQAPELERAQRHFWPGFLVGYLPEDLERLRHPDPNELQYPLKEQK